MTRDYIATARACEKEPANLRTDVVSGSPTIRAQRISRTTHSVLYGEIVETTRIGESVPLPRLQLFELEDLAWFPPAIRDFATDYLHFMETRFALHKPVVPLLRAMLENARTECVVDLCSGGGGPVLAIYEALAADGIPVQFTLD